MFNKDTETPSWPNAVKKIEYISTADNTKQPAMFYGHGKQNARPLLVALHPWSFDYQDSTYGPFYAQWCIEHEWVFMHPDFRGPNKRPEATGSELMVKDIISAVDYAKESAVVDESRVYLAGVSGGGHGALLMAGRAAELWAAVSAWVPVSDLKAWYYQCKESGRKYTSDIEASCGGIPENGSEAEKQCRLRSPLTYLANAKMPVDINAGIHDGHTGSVPISHALNAFNALASEADRLSDEHITYFVEKEAVPCTLVDSIGDPLYGERKVLFRRQSNNSRVTIFEGGHEIIHTAALSWLAKQTKNTIQDREL